MAILQIYSTTPLHLLYHIFAHSQTQPQSGWRSAFALTPGSVNVSFGPALILNSYEALCCVLKNLLQKCVLNTLLGFCVQVLDKGRKCAKPVGTLTKGT